MLVSNVNTGRVRRHQRKCNGVPIKQVISPINPTKMQNWQHQILTGCQDDVITLLALIIANEEAAKYKSNRMK